MAKACDNSSAFWFSADNILTCTATGALIAHFVYSCCISKKRVSQSLNARGYKLKWQPKCVRSHLSRQVNIAFQTRVIESTSACSVIQRCSSNCWGMFVWPQAWEKAQLILKLLPLPLKFLLSLNSFHSPSETSFCHSWFHTLNVNIERTVMLHCLKYQCRVWLSAGVFDGKGKCTFQQVCSKGRSGTISQVKLLWQNICWFLLFLPKSRQNFSI